MNIASKIHDDKLKLMKYVKRTINKLHDETLTRCKTEDEVDYLKYLIEISETLKNKF